MSANAPEPIPLQSPPTGARPWSVHVASLNGRLLVVVRGRLVVGAGADPVCVPGPARDLAGDVELNLADVTAIDAAGVAHVLRLRNRVAASGGRLVLGSASRRVQRVLRTVGAGAWLRPQAETASPTTTSTVRQDDALLCGCAC